MGLLSTAAKAAISSGANFAMFLELDLISESGGVWSSATERYWSGTYSKQFQPTGDDAASTWAPTGNFGRISPVESSEDFRANGLTVEIGGLPATSMQAGTLTAPNYKDRPARWILAVMDADDTVIWHKIMYYTIDVLTYAIIGSGGTPAGLVRCSLEHEVTRATRLNTRRYSHSDQTEEYPGDLGFYHLAYLASDAEVYWGSNGTTFK